MHCTFTTERMPKAICFKWLAAAVVLVLMGGVLQSAEAQRRVVIESGDYGNLNVVIEGDTTETGERVDENTVYVLRRGVTYWLEGSLQNPGYHLRLEAEEGDGHPPIMRPGVDVTGSSARLFLVRGDFSISGIYVSNLDEFGAKQQQLFRVTGDSVKLWVDNTWMEWDRQSFFSFQTAGNSAFVTNSKGRNVGIRTSTGNGRIFDTRGNNQDSIVVENTTFYAFVNRPFLGSDAVINYLKWNHTTMVDIGQFWDGSRVIEQEITNNLLVNVNYWGSGIPDPADPTDEVSAFFRVDSMLAMQEVSDLDRDLVFRNNIFYRDQELIDLNTEFDRTEVQLFDATLRHWMDEGVIVTAENNLDYDEHEDEVVFEDRPTLPVEFRRAYLAEFEDEANFPWFQDLGDEREQTSLDQWRDFTYQTEALAYTYADGGFPLGDLNWFPDKKAEWEEAQTVDTEDDVAGLPKQFQLLGNYPNPFNPATSIVFELASPSEVTLQVYNVLGQKVETLKLGHQGAGRHDVTYDAAHLASGIYLVQMQAGDQVQSIRMVLTK